MSKRTRILLIVLCFALALFSGMTYSFMFRSTNTTQNDFLAGNVTVSVSNGTTVTNNGNAPAYIRVRYVVYCTDDNNIVGVNPPTDTTFSGTTGWVAGTKNVAGNFTWYYATPVAAGGSVTIPTCTKGTVDGYTVVLEVFAESIQAQPVDAVKAAWGVTLSGTTITSAP